MSFSDEVSAHLRKYEARLSRVFRDSVSELAAEASRSRDEGGRMPVVTGNLRRSIRAALNATPSENSLSVGGALIQWSPGDSVTIGWTANDYARRVEYGFTGTDSLGRRFNQLGAGFARGAAEQWSRIVDRNAERAKSRGL